MNSVSTWTTSAIGWMDERGDLAWIALLVFSFIFFWPLGIAVLFVWIPRMGKTKRKYPSKAREAGFKSSGNLAFDNYKARELRRLEEEQASFEAYLQTLREAKDKSEFDQFMEDRARKAELGTQDSQLE